MEKYKRIVREVKNAFPEATDVRVIVFTSQAEQASFEAKIREFLEMDCFKLNDVDSLAITGAGTEISFNGKIFVRNGSN